ncbi:anti-sigma factor family protein [Nocardioides cynanchi]|uniref:anti-sigma factor family protein n=1 Tax=Nocardioides cynanchi TaxID=2558918 RepID=UPI001244E6F0|nr:zf-HC2 domain-containing protein [Nocardioides cynanchi]
MSVTPIRCPFAMDDGAYVLGSLSPAERKAFEAHLPGCEHCSVAVRDLAGLPGLLGRLDADVFDLPAIDPVPDTLLPRLSRAVRRQQHRRTWLIAGAAAAVAAAISIGGVAAFDHPHPGTPVAVAPPLGPAMTQIGNDPMTAHLAVTQVGWGTKLDLTCTYPVQHRGASYDAGAYALVVHTLDGRSQRVATWSGLPGKTMHLSAATASQASDISSVNVVRVGGPPVLALHL